MEKLFESREEVESFLLQHMPFAIRPKKKAKTTFVSPFTSSHAGNIILTALSDAIWTKQKQYRDKLQTG